MDPETRSEPNLDRWLAEPSGDLVAENSCESSASARATVAQPGGRCRSCGRLVYGRGRVCKSRECPEYSHTWAGDQRRKLFANLSAYSEGSGEVLMSAVTAPGADLLPWDRTRCAALGEHKCSGLLGCHVDRIKARRWNLSASDRWRRLHRRAYQLTIKKHGRRSVRLLARIWELQHRGVLHVHPVLGCGTPRQKAGAYFYLERLAELAPQYGFGWVDHRRSKVKPRAPQEAAAYLSSYFVEGKNGKTVLWESVRSSSMPRSIIHVSAELTQRTRCTMRNLRLNRALHVVWRLALDMEDVHAVGELLRAFPGSELIPVWEGVRGPPL